MILNWIAKRIGRRMREKAQTQREAEEIISEPAPQSPKPSGEMSGKAELLSDKPEVEYPTLDESSRINAQYRNADIARWQTMDFVIGYKINRSRNCDYCCEICAAGEGIYPKSFNWEGWHPGCLCYLTSVSLSADEMARINHTFLNGGDWEREQRRLGITKQITSYPENFKAWVWKHKDNLQEAIRQNGLIDFVTANPEAIKSILSEPCPDICKYEAYLEDLRLKAKCDSVQLEAVQKERIFDECIRLINSTTNIDVLDRRYNSAVEIAGWVNENKDYLFESNSIFNKAALFNSRIYDEAILRISSTLYDAANTPIKKKNAKTKIEALKSKIKHDSPVLEDVERLLLSLESGN